MNRRAGESTPQLSIVLFDADCPFCARWTRFIFQHDPAGHFRFAPRQSEAARRLLSERGMHPDNLSSIAVIHARVVLTHSDAVLHIVGRLRFPWNLLSAFRLVPKRIRDFGYALIARNRYRLSVGRRGCPIAPGAFEGRVVG